MEESQTGNVFQQITADIPQDKFKAIVEEFRTHEEEFTEYLENLTSDYLIDNPDNQLSEFKNDHISLSYNKQAQQRSLTVKKSLQRSQLVLEEEPIISVLSSQHINNYCSCCFMPSKSLKQCSGCKYCSYCNQDCQKKHWNQHKQECSSMKNSLRQVPQSLRILLLMVWMKTDQKNKDFMKNLMVYNQQLSIMISNASKGLSSDYDKREEVMNYSMIVFLRNRDFGFRINLENFKTIVHLYFISICNGFGIADDQMLRIGTGIYHPQNYINHSCEPNCLAIFRGKRQFIIASRDIKEGEDLSICYIDNGIEERLFRQQYLREQYYFNCICERCLEQIKQNTDALEMKKSLTLSEELESINQKSLECESKGKLQESLDHIDQILKAFKDDVYSKSILKELLERASYLCVIQTKFKEAISYHERLITLCESLYLKKDSLPHPLLAFHYYQVGKLHSQNGDFKKATEYLQKSTSLFTSYYAVKSKIDGKMINEKLIHETNENYLANQQLI